MLVEYQRRRWQAASEAAQEVDDDGREDRSPADLSLSEQLRDLDAAAERAGENIRQRLARMPPANALMPTALGNALRAGEIRAGERYGLTTLTSWPRIFPQLSQPLAKALAAARDALDTAVNLCYSFLACAATMGFAVYDESDKWWLPAAALAIAGLAYKGAVTAAQAYAQLIHVVYDLHRFDLVKALHYRLPRREDEWELFQRISDDLADQEVTLPYDHGTSGPNERDRCT
ncbi:hypothetical protein [Nonomuraea rubra]|uniref:Uncharacterized protein n=1 Tax=Nonomuraea rubra TaxID=46180 RepID=A0A7X0NP41_9ACTN|nr:hypothetical protein [Nonomuraea rubra]MBB6547045.1 hypothetical protein [Nonomuraea rubra]